jgi:2-keto-4-pentenoate hydratase/2-oxohepta-3-ene-1,7-dioic acid hydratase in catechol pathway
VTLEPGDIVSPGTPEGVGSLSPGDEVEVELEGLDILSNPVQEEGDVGA